MRELRFNDRYDVNGGKITCSKNDEGETVFAYEYYDKNGDVQIGHTKSFAEAIIKDKDTKFYKDSEHTIKINNKGISDKDYAIKAVSTIIYPVLREKIRKKYDR